MKIVKYFKELEDKVHVAYSIAEEARRKGLDPKSSVEVPLATSLAGRVAGLISTVYPQLNNPPLVDRILELEKQWGALDPAICLQIAEEIAKEKFCKFSSHLEAIDAGIRVGMAYITLGVVSSPIEGFTHLKLKKTRDGQDYFAAYYSGPIRSAGGTGAAFSLVIIDYLREIFGYAKFDPDEKEVKRFVTELYDYHERVTNLQYLPTEDEIAFLAANIPIQIDGDPSEDKEVSNYKDLARVATNIIRSGVCLTLGEGLAQKAPKITRYVKKLREKGFKLSAWDFLDGYNELHKKRESGTAKESPTYIQDLVAGRPVFGHPSASGAFRLRYGRARNTGYSCLAIHPATCYVLDGFIAIGTQLKIELPTKGCAIATCDTIEPPIIKMKNGSVRQLRKMEDVKNIYKEIEEIIYLGDLLVPFGDFANRNHVLEPAGYCEDEWLLELKKVSLEDAAKITDVFEVDIETSFELSKKFNIPLHPRYSYFWSQISYDYFIAFLDWLSRARVSEEKLIIPYNRTDRERFKRGKRTLELLGISHEVVTEDIIINKADSRALLISLGINFSSECSLEKEIVDYCTKIKSTEKVLELVNQLSLIRIRDRAGTFIGTRMGRPEKAKLRKLVGSPNVLFPVGEEGGRLRSVNASVEAGFVKSDFPIYYCDKCQKETIYFVCENCGSETRKMRYCPECKNKFFMETCPEHVKGINYSERNIDSKHYFDAAVKKIGMMREEIPSIIKGVRGTSNKDHVPENLAKGLLRTLFKLNVNKDGTIRYDATELPITHFKPREAGVSIEKLRELGYLKDVYGEELAREDQILEIFPHDIFLPCCPDTLDEKADDVFVNIAGFIDSLLLRFYNLKPFYNIHSRDDLVGHLVCCIAPHNCAGVVARIIGFSKSQGLVASPYMHAAMRRDCFGYDTYIPIKEGVGWKIRKIGEVVEALNPQKIVDSWETKEISVKNFETLGFEGKIREARINNFTKHSKMRMLELKTALGKKLKVTENHKFFIDEKIKRASDLKIGDKLPLPIKVDIKSKKLDEINLLDCLKDEELMIRGIKEIIEGMDKNQLNSLLKRLNVSKKQFSNFNLRDSYPIKFVLELDCRLIEKISRKGKIAAKRDTVEVPIIVKLSRELLEVIGLYIAEGYSRAVKGRKGLNQVYVASSEKEIREFVKKTIKESFGLAPSEREEDRVTFSSKVFYLFFAKILEAGIIAKDKRIPSLFLDLELDKLACVLRGYFEGDGSAEKKRKKILCDSVSEGLLHDLEFCLARFGIFAKRYEYEKEPGPKVRDFYIKKKREIPKFKITKLIIGSDFVNNFMKIGFLSERKNKILESYKNINAYGMEIEKDETFVYDSIVSIEDIGERESYCLNVNTKNHLVVANSIVSQQCDGDEAAILLLLDLLINFSREFLPAHRGGTQDAPLVLNARIRAGEVDDMIFDIDVVKSYGLELYEAAARHEHPSKIKIEQIKNRVGNEEFTNLWFTHDSFDINEGAVCSSYKSIPNMKEKVSRQMELVEKIRAADTMDVARLVIERHFIRDIRGNLRKFSQQEFRCSKCNEKFRRPPLQGTCTNCGGNIIFTISEGSIVKYLEPALDIARKYKVPAYVLQNLELTRRYIESIFGREKEKQAELEKWF